MKFESLHVSVVLAGRQRENGYHEREEESIFGQANAAAQDGFLRAAASQRLGRPAAYLMDYVSNSVMMPFIALLSAILTGWVKTPQYVIGEMERNGEHFRRKGVYTIMIRDIAPVMMFVLFLQATGILS